MTGVLKTPNVPLARAWNTWAADRYLEMTFKPLGIRVTPMLYAASTGKTSFVGPGSTIRLGAHATDGSLVTARVGHAGTTLDWHYAKPSGYRLEGGWSTVEHGEWALRFWVVLALSAEDGSCWRYDPEAGMALFTHGPRTVALAAERAPLLVTGHASHAALAAEYETQGYWYLASRATEAPVLALRFNLEEAATNRFAAAIADRTDLARKRVAEMLAESAEPVRAPASGPQASLEAIRDIMGWNTIWDGVNHRPYITCSRNWDLKKFGGFGFWLNDTAVNALLVSLLDPDQGREGLKQLLYGSTPEGNLPCLITGNDAWVDRTQNPLVAFVTWLMFLRSRDRSLLEAAYPVLAANNAWLLASRDGNGNGLLEYGSSDVGEGLYVGTKLAAKDESFMDNSPMHDEASWNEASRTLDAEDVGLNSMAALDCEVLGWMAAELGDGERAAAHEAAAERLREKIRSELWDESRGIFANRLWSGKFVRSLTPTSFFPLLCQATTPEQTRRLLAHLEDPKSFGGTWVLPTVQRTDPAYHDNVYWRGRIWPVLNWLVWNGLRRAGETAAADRLADGCRVLFETSWRELRLAPENYNPDTGEGLDQADTDPFYSWGGLLPLIEVSQLMELSPWHGWSLRPPAKGAEAGRLGPLASPAGPVTVVWSKGEIALERCGRELLATNLARPLTRLEIANGRVQLGLPEGAGKGTWLRLGGVPREQVLLARQGEAKLEVAGGEAGAELRLHETDEPGHVIVLLRPE